MANGDIREIGNLKLDNISKSKIPIMPYGNKEKPCIQEKTVNPKKANNKPIE